MVLNVGIWEQGTHIGVTIQPQLYHYCCIGNPLMGPGKGTASIACNESLHESSGQAILLTLFFMKICLVVYSGVFL